MGEPAPKAVRVSEAFADGLASEEELNHFGAEMGAEWREHDEPWRPFPRTCELTEALASRVSERAWLGEIHNYPAEMGITELPEWLKTSEFARDIFGNPFRPVALEPAWLTSDVLLLARGIYDDRAFDRMPILADALQDAGCDNYDVLNHCRAPGAHVRGCWVVDLLLGKK